MKNKGSPPPDGNDPAADSRHQDTVGIGVMSMATVVLIGMFGLLEVAGSFDASKVTDDTAKSFVQAANFLIPAFSAFTVLLYVWCVISGTDAIANGYARQFDLSRRRHVVAIALLPGMVVLVGSIGGLTIVARAIAN